MINMIHDIINITFTIIPVLLGAFSGWMLAKFMTNKLDKQLNNLKRDYEILWSTNQKLAEANKNLQKYIEDNK